MANIKPISGVDDRVALAEALPLNTPFTLNLFPSNACNFKCNYCAQSLGSNGLRREYNFDPEVMSLDIIRAVVSQAREFPGKFKLVSLMGHGEPLVNSRLATMVDIIKRAEVAGRIDVITNASLLTKEKSKELIEAGIDVIRISLQGLSSEKYRQVSNVKVDFGELVDNIAYAYNHRKACRIFVKIIDVGIEAGEADHFYELFDRISDRMYIEKVKPVYDGVAYQENVINVTCDRYGNAHEKRYVCPHPFYALSVWPNGDVASCDAIYKPNTLGNVRQQGLLDMWNSEGLRNFRLMQLKGGRHGHPACRRCCAPDDVSHTADILDSHAEKLIEIFMQERIYNEGAIV